MLIISLIKGLSNLLSKVDEPQTYGSALEAYIVSKNPQTTYDVEYWSRQFDEKMANRTSSGWPL